MSCNRFTPQEEPEVITLRRQKLKAYVDDAVSKGFDTFKPSDDEVRISTFDQSLIQPYCNSIGLTLDGPYGLFWKLVPLEKVEEAWAKDLQGPKPGWFKLWVNKILYWINK